MKIVKIKEESAFFGVLITEFSPMESKPLIFMQDRDTKLKVSIQGFTKTIPIGTAIYGRGHGDQNKEDREIKIDLKQERHRIIGISADYIQKNTRLNSADNFSCLMVSDGKPIFGFENFDGFDFKNLRETFNLFRVIRTELEGEDKNKIGSGMVPKYIFGEAIKFYFEEFKVNFEYHFEENNVFKNKNIKRTHWRKNILKRNSKDKGVTAKKTKVGTHARISPKLILQEVKSC